MLPPKMGFLKSKKIFLLTRLSEVTAEEPIITIFAVATFYLNTYIAISLFVKKCSVLSVEADLSKPAS